jgi:hypothetical protein
MPKKKPSPPQRPFITGPPPEPPPNRMPKTEVWHPPWCLICRKPITQPRTGRPRSTCSDRCRQRLHRRQRKYEQRNAISDANHHSFVHYIDRTVAEFTRKYGPPPEDRPDMYSVIAYRRYYDLYNAYQHCAECGKPFINDAIGRKPKYCSDSCKHRAYGWTLKKRYHGYRTPQRCHTDDDELGRIAFRRRLGLPIPVCAECGREFLEKQFGPWPKYCSKRCRQRAWRYRRRPLYRTCRHCGSRYRVTHHSGAPQKYCSPECCRRAKILRERARRNAARVAPDAARDSPPHESENMAASVAAAVTTATSPAFSCHKTHPLTHFETASEVTG